ncbi:hypothetical protein [Albirhodobacter sp. R86504]|jgi:predicted small lipoprotein YifL|uniref:hypothetical protein n=1 Tax=Albirhodobacter sp. R86504 TaxID=3093848 RepID=UPI0036714027
MRRAFLGVMALCALGFLAACEPEGPEPLPPVGDRLIALESDTCAAQGGELVQMGVLSLCRKEPRDGGKSCRIGSDCEGACLARSMTCSPVSPLRGCNEIITNSGARVTECVN